MPSYIEEFSFENIDKALMEAVEKQASVDGVKTVSFQEYKEEQTVERLSFEEVKTTIGKYATKLDELGRFDEFEEIVSNNLGVGKKVSTATKKSIDQLEIILSELESLEVDISDVVLDEE